MMDFLATNFNLPTIIGAVIVFGGTGLIVCGTLTSMAALAAIAVAAATVSVAAPVAAMAPAKKMQKSLQSSNGLPKKRQRLTQVRYIKA